MKHIFLIGPRASGKTTVAQELSKHLGRSVIDTDECIKKIINCSISDFIHNNSWDSFRDIESSTLKDIINKNVKKEIIISTGGGIILREDNRSLMKEYGIVIYLKADEDILIKRLLADPNKSQRPSLTSFSLQDEVHNILEKRSELYERSSDFIVNANGSIEEITSEILNCVEAKMP